MVISLGRLSPATSRGLPAAQATRAGSRCLLGLAPAGGYRAAPVARRAVGSYPTISPLPLDTGRFVFCGPIRRLTAPRRYLAACPVELGLSSTRPACDTPRPSRPTTTRPETYRRPERRGKPSVLSAAAAARDCRCARHPRPAPLPGPIPAAAARSRRSRQRRPP